GAWQYFPTGAKFVQIDIDPHAIAMNWRPDVALVGDAALCLEDLGAAMVRLDVAAAGARREHIGKAQFAYLEEVAADCAEAQKPSRTRQIMAAINRVFGGDTILLNEIGGADLWSYYGPYYRVLDAGCCVPMAEQTAMGMGIIGTIGAKLACPERNVVCVAGDAAFAMAMMELATAAERRLGVTWVVLNNQSLGWPQYLQVLENRQAVATDFPSGPDYVKIAEAQGCTGMLVEDPEAVEPALAAALAANRKGIPALVDFRIAKHDYPPHFADFHREVFGLGRNAPG